MISWIAAPQQRYVQVSQRLCHTIILDYQTSPSMFLNIKHHYQCFWISNITDFVWISHITRPFSETKKCLSATENALQQPVHLKQIFVGEIFFIGLRNTIKDLVQCKQNFFREHFSSTLLGPNVHSNDPPFIALPRPALHWWPPLLH